MTNLGQMTDVLRHRDFRFLWLAQSSSVIGDRIVTVALALFVIDLTGSATDLGLVFAAQSLPLVAFLLIGGVWADRLPRHRVMMVTDLVRFVLHGLLAVLIFLGSVEIWQLVAIEAVFGTAEAFFRPAATGLLPQTVPDAQLQQANAMITLFENVAEFAGPALATALVLGAGAGSAFALDAATFLFSAAFLARVRPHARGAAVTPTATPERETVWKGIREGSREVRARSWVWGTLLAFCVALFTGRPVRHLVDDRAGRAHPCRQALARELLRLDGLGRAAPSRLRSRRPPRRRARRRRCAPRRLGARVRRARPWAAAAPNPHARALGAWRGGGAPGRAAPASGPRTVTDTYRTA
jgi:MFS family permease